MNISLKIGFQKFDIESLNGGPWELKDSKGYDDDDDELNDIMEMATFQKAQYLTTDEVSFNKFLINFLKDLEYLGDKSICFMQMRGAKQSIVHTLQFDKMFKIVNNDYWVRCFFNKD